MHTPLDGTVRHLNGLRCVSVVLRLVLCHAIFHLLLVREILEESQAGLLALLNQVLTNTMVLDVEEPDLGACGKDFLCYGLSLFNIV